MSRPEIVVRRRLNAALLAAWLLLSPNGLVFAGFAPTLHGSALDTGADIPRVNTKVSAANTAGAASALAAGVAYGINESLGLNHLKDAQGNPLRGADGKLLHGANAVGRTTEVLSPQNVAGHAALGAVAAKLTGRDTVAGALGGAGAALVNPLIDPLTSTTDATDRTVQHVAATMLATGAAAAALGRDAATAAGAAQNETLNNYLTQENIEQKQARLILGCPRSF